MMGQSNANSDLARAIIRESGMSVHQINHGGQRIETWLEPPDQWLDEDVDFLGDREFQYFVWFQGESNRNGYPGYERKLKQILSAVSPDKTTEVIIVGVWMDDEDMTEFRAYQKEMCDRNAHFHYVDSKNCARRDGIHLSAYGQYQLARKIRLLIESLE
ncbi:MAG: hypothetical protein JXR76_05720 [Deltaproteobacteria bacterium]|nr:hypothetical protein [Deltaproteobacteria bacterium]